MNAQRHNRTFWENRIPAEAITMYHHEITRFRWFRQVAFKITSREVLFFSSSCFINKYNDWKCSSLWDYNFYVTFIQTRDLRISRSMSTNWSF
jgi:hypothetical protein